MIVLDSSFIVGFFNERDAHHAAASTLMDQFLAGNWGKGLLLEYVFLEVVTVLMARRDLRVAREWVRFYSKRKSWNSFRARICFLRS